MPTIAKVPRANGVAWKAIIKRRGAILKTKTFATKTAARAWARRVEADAEMMEALGEDGARMLLKDLCSEYLEQWDGRAHSRIYQVKWWVKKLGDVYVNDLSPDQVRAKLNQYKEGNSLQRIGSDVAGRSVLRESSKQRAPATVNRMKAALSAVYRYAAKQGYTSKNPARKIAVETENNRRVRYLSETERKSLLLACRDSSWDRLYLLVLMALMTGARKGELKNLRWEQIDFSSRTAELSLTKNGEPRVVSFPRPVIEEMLKFRKPAGLIFYSVRRPDRAFEEKKVWAIALRKAGIEDFRFHDLRHSAASYLAMNGATLLEIAHVLGHKSLQTTKRYAHLDVGHSQQLTDRVLGKLAELET